LSDPDASVRTQAAWSLGFLGDAGAGSQLSPLLARADADPAIAAAAAIGRIAERAKNPALASRALCPALTDLRPYVRANALAGLSVAGARCVDPAPEYRALENDPSDAVRAAAALTIARTPAASEAARQLDRRALERCATTDRSGRVAVRCRTPPPRPSATHSVTIYPVPEGLGTPKAHAAYVLELADGMLHAGTCDRRGAALEPVAPEGEVSLLRGR
jgi:hypothetical protein